MRCIVQLVETLADGRTLYRCGVCGKEGRFRCADPARVGMQCGVMVSAVGPGAELAAIFRELGIKPKSGCGCRELARWMNHLGVAGCRLDRDALAKQLREKASAFGWSDWAAAGWKAATSGLALRINPADPFGSLVDLAIERARRLAPGACAFRPGQSL